MVLDHPVLGMPVFGWLPPRHALTPQRRVIIGRKQFGNPVASGYGAIARGQVEVLKVAQYTRSCMELLFDTVKDGIDMNMMEMLLANHTCTWC